MLQKPSIETMERTCTCTFDMRDNNCLELIERVFYKETKAKARLVMWLPLRFFSLKIVFITFTSCMLSEKEELYEIRILCCRKFYWIEVDLLQQTCCCLRNVIIWYKSLWQSLRKRFVTNFSRLLSAQGFVQRDNLFPYTPKNNP